MRRRSRIKEPVEFYSMLRAIRVIDYADIVILIFDTTEGVVDQDRRIASLVLSKAKGFVIVPNKIDLIDKKDRNRIVPSTYKSFKSLDFVPVIPISAKDDLGIETLLNCVLDVYFEGGKVADKDVLTNLPQSLRPPTDGELLKLRQIKTRPPIFRATLTTSAKENYIRYLRYSIRNYFGFKGIPILIKTKVVRRRFV
jgi:GTP-binding protein